MKRFALHAIVLFTSAACTGADERVVSPDQAFRCIRCSMTTSNPKMNR